MLPVALSSTQWRATSSYARRLPEGTTLFWVTHYFGRLAQVLKLTLSQVEIGFDVLKARDVNPPASASEHAASTTSSSEGDAKKEASGSEETEEERRDREEVLKKFRLMVKRRLLKRYGGGLSSDVSTRKGQLDELYGQVEGNLLELGVKLRAENGRA